MTNEITLSANSGGADVGTNAYAPIRSQLAHLRDLLGERITLAGPAVQLAPSAAQTLGVVVHELSTNATKYGALSTPLGRIAINWTLEGGRFRLTWQEAEGPSVVAPACAGYGSTVIAAMTRMTLSADVTIDYAPAGLVWTLQCALENIIDPYSEG